MYMYLCALYVQVVENETVTKTQRLRLFNDYSLAQISRLYNWTGHAEEGGDNAEEERGEVNNHRMQIYPVKC